jgi:hypothetical protein
MNGTLASPAKALELAAPVLSEVVEKGERPSVGRVNRLEFPPGGVV